MGRGKPTVVASKQGEQLASAVTDTLCAICGDQVVLREEEFLRVHCNKCTECTVHLQCGIEYLIARASEKTNSIAQNKYKVKARKQPVQIFEQRMPCPNGAFQIETDGQKVPGSQTARSKHTLIGTCGGFTLGAELVNPAKEPPAPLPQILPARAPKEKTDKKKAKEKEKEEAGRAAAPKRAASAASSASSASASGARRSAAGVPAPGAGASVRLLGAGHSPWTTVGAKKAGGAGVPGAPPPPDRLMPPGVPRPLELTLCKHLLEDSDCFVYRCPEAHSEEELRQREREWVARQEAKKRGAALRQAAAQAAAAARFEEEQEMLAQIASMETLNAPPPSTQPAPNAWGIPGPAPAPTTATARPASPGPRLSERSLSLLRAFKRSCCLNTLLSMGFDAGQAAAATDAAAGDAERAAQLAIDGVRSAGVLPVNVSREAEELASAACAAGADAEAVEAALMLAGGNWEGAIEALRSPQDFGAPGGSTATAEDLASRAPSQPDTPSQRGASAAPWAVDAASSLSAPSPYSASPGAAPGLFATAAPAATSAAPGVLSLADFSAGPVQEAGPAGAAIAVGGWQAGAVAYGGVAPANAFGTAQPSAAAVPADARFDSPLPPSTSSAGGYDDGFAAGMAAATAMLGQQHPAVYGAPMAGGAAADMPGYWPAAAPQAAQQGQEEELADLLQMLGVSS
ncbi:hypothetical protein ABPG75_004920 [Micractinium tetrahymenae]